MKLVKCVMKKHKRMCSFWEKLFEKFRKFPRKTFWWNCFLKQSCRLPDTYWECSGKLMKFSEQVLQETSANASFCNVSTKRFFKKYLIRFDIQWLVLPGIKCIIEVWRPFTVYLGLYLVCSVHFSSCYSHLDKHQRHEHCLDYTYSYFF